HDALPALGLRPILGATRDELLSVVVEAIAGVVARRFTARTPALDGSESGDPPSDAYDAVARVGVIREPELRLKSGAAGWELQRDRVAIASIGIDVRSSAERQSEDADRRERCACQRAAAISRPLRRAVGLPSTVALGHLSPRVSEHRHMRH